MSVAIIDYGSGNLRSATKAFERAVREAGLDVKIHLTNDPDVVRKADRIVLPGVGAFVDCKEGLEAIPDLRQAVVEAVEERAAPFLGICVGTQFMATRGMEKTDHAGTPGFGWIDGDVVEIEPDDPALKIPQIGWNTLDICRPHPVVEGIPTGENGLHAYFVHSYHLKVDRVEDLVATTNYGGPVTAIVARDNMIGTQFHPEKSQKLGLALITNFLKWKP